MNVHSLSMLFLIFIFFFIDFSFETLSKHSKSPVNNKRNFNAKIRERRNEKNIKIRKLEDEFEPTMTFGPLKIYIDLAEFNETFPENTDLNIDNFIRAMYKSKEILEDFVEINSDNTGFIDIDDTNEYSDYTSYLNEKYGIEHWTPYFDDNKKIKFDEYNFYIFAKFTELHEESSLFSSSLLIKCAITFCVNITTFAIQNDLGITFRKIRYNIIFYGYNNRSLLVYIAPLTIATHIG